jgi:hypothetical protein
MSSGNYAVFVNGFRVNQETWDNALQTDGKRDEVFVEARVGHVRNAAPILNQSRRTATIGDTNWKIGRIKGGSASSKGGLRSGDEFPKAEPWARANGASPNGLPMKLWQGTLVEGQDVLTVIPSIIEDDEGGVDMYSSLVAWGANAVNTLAPSLQQLLGPGASPYVAAAQAGLQVLSSLPVGKNGNRPIGIQGGVYNPQILTLDYRLAEAVVGTDLGKGPGVVEFTYTDSTDIGAGSYSLYLQVERA